MYIERDIRKKIEQVSKTFPVILLTGPRQVGKTTLLKEMDKERTYVTLDDPTIRLLAKEDPAMFFKRYNTPILIDEIQYAPELLPYIKMQVDKENKAGEFWLTGSQKFTMMQDVSESLAGRIAVLEMLGISYDELNNIKSNEIFLPTEEYLYKRAKKKLNTEVNIFKNIFKGSMPKILANEDVDIEVYYASYLDTYIKRDVRQLTQVADEMQFTKFLIAIAARTGCQLNYDSIANEVGVTINTIKQWISILVTSGIVYLLEPYANNILTRMNKMPKLYFLDTGFCAFLTKWSNYETLEVSNVAGNFFETYVVSEIIKKYYNNGKRPQIYYYRDKDKIEIDLIINENNTLYPIEIKQSATPKREWIKNFRVLEKLNMPIGQGGIICMINDLLPIDEKNNFIPVQYI